MDENILDFEEATHEAAYNQGRDYGVVIGKRLAYNELSNELTWMQALSDGGVALDANKVLAVLRLKIRNLHAATDEAAFAPQGQG